MEGDNNFQGPISAPTDILLENFAFSEPSFSKSPKKWYGRVCMAWSVIRQQVFAFVKLNKLVLQNLPDGNLWGRNRAHNKWSGPWCVIRSVRQGPEGA